MYDRSVSALRTLRPDDAFDKSIFWFRDDLHQPYTISPMGMTTIQAHHAWAYHVASDLTQLPPSKGAHVKMYKGRVYLGFALISDPAEIGARAAEVRATGGVLHRQLGGVLQEPDRRGTAQPGHAERCRH